MPQRAQSDAGRSVFPVDAPALLSRKQVRQYTGIPERSLSRYVASGVAPKAIHVGGRPRWRRDELESWILQDCQMVRKGVSR
jgi:predicted DNA-binding transcriptional regulator AlpA